jgi:tetrahydromethanopterin S-methyltransferase subunit G
VKFKNVNSRLDKIGKSVTYLEDDAPTREEYDKLEKRVTKVALI